MIKVSVIVPVYNAEKYLRKCLDSLVGQTLREIEIVAVNDGSTDGSLDILEEYRAAYPEKVKVFSKENGGQATARNLALVHASGEYIGYVDADDYADVHMFDSLYKAAVDSSADLTVCDHYRVENGKSEYVRFPDYDTPRGMFRAVLVSPWNKLFKKKVLTDSGVIFPEGYIYEDTAWFAELIPFIGTMKYVHEPLLYHIVQENSTMTSAQGRRTADIFPVLNGVVEFYKKNGLFDEYRDDVECFYVRISLFSSVRRIAKIADKKLKSELLDRTLKELDDKFPDFRKNCRLNGWRGIYVRHASPSVIHVFAFFCGLCL